MISQISPFNFENRFKKVKYQSFRAEQVAQNTVSENNKKNTDSKWGHIAGIVALVVILDVVANKVVDSFSNKSINKEFKKLQENNEKQFSEIGKTLEDLAKNCLKPIK